MSELQKAVRHPLRSFSVAFRFLTIFPFLSLAGDDTDYFGAARAGATTVMIPEEYTRFPASLAELIAREQLSIFYTVPYALLQLLQAGVIPQHRYPALRAVLFGGEPIPPKHLLEIMKLWPGADFYNVYGPTETNGVTHWQGVRERRGVGAGQPGQYDYRQRRG